MIFLRILLSAHIQITHEPEPHPYLLLFFLFFFFVFFFLLDLTKKTLAHMRRKKTGAYIFKRQASRPDFTRRRNSSRRKRVFDEEEEIFGLSFGLSPSRIIRLGLNNFLKTSHYHQNVLSSTRDCAVFFGNVPQASRSQHQTDYDEFA